MATQSDQPQFLEKTGSIFVTQLAHDILEENIHSEIGLATSQPGDYTAQVMQAQTKAALGRHEEAFRRLRVVIPDESQKITRVSLGDYINVRDPDGDVIRLYVSGLNDPQRRMADACHPIKMIGAYTFDGRFAPIGLSLLKNEVAEGQEIPDFAGWKVLEIGRGSLVAQVERDTVTHKIGEYRQSLLESTIDTFIDATGFGEPELEKYRLADKKGRIDQRMAFEPEYRHLLLLYANLWQPAK